mgnify:CR=1 FL=1
METKILIKLLSYYKTGFKNEIGNAKERFGKSSGIGDKVKKMCSDISDEVKGVCSDVSLNTCRDCGEIKTKIGYFIYMS